MGGGSAEGFREVCWRVLFCILAVVLAACSRSGSSVTVHNQSATVVSNVLVSGSTFERNLGSIGPGTHKSFAIGVDGPTALRMSFEAGTGTVDTGPLCNLSHSMQDGVLIISSNLTVRCVTETTLR